MSDEGRRCYRFPVTGNSSYFVSQKYLLFSFKPKALHYGGNATVRTIQVYVMTAASAGAYPGGEGGGGGRVEPAHPPFSASTPSR